MSNLLTRENFIKNGVIYVSLKDWQEILKTHPLEDISKFIANLVVEEKTPFPYSGTKETLKDDFSMLKNEDIFKVLYFESWDAKRVKINYDMTYKGQPIYIGISYVGRNCSNFFFEKERMKVKSRGKRLSPLDRWTDPIKNYKMFHFLEHEEVVSTYTFRSCLRLSGGGMASQFSTMLAKTIYTITQAKNVLDFSAGWGDRLTGALSTESVVSYTGIDPNTNLHPLYKELSAYFKHNKKTHFICSPAEDAELESNQFDVIFTSPPYFDLEIYTNEETQSISKFRKLEDWLNLFLFKVIERSYDWLKKDGRLILNISDYGNTFFNQKMIEYAESLGFKFEGVIGYELQKRPGKQINYNEGIFCEPIFFFSKGIPSDLLLNNPNSLF